MKKVMLITVMLCLFFVSGLLGQAPGDTLWTKTYGGVDIDSGTSVQQTTDGGYIVTGTTENFGAGGNDVWLIKTNTSGDTLWTKTYGGTNDDLGQSVQQTTDGGYIVAGWTKSSSFCNLGYLIKTDSDGDTLWTKILGDDGFIKFTEFYSVQQTTDGGYVAAGFTTCYGAGGYDVYLIKTDSNGDTLWTNTYGGAGADQGWSVQQTTDGGYIVAGFTESYAIGNLDVYLVKTDSNGDTLWTKTYGGTGYEKGFSARQTSDGGYIVGGYTGTADMYSRDMYLIKTDSNGDTLWTKIYGGATGDEESRLVIQTSDGGYIATGSTASYGAGSHDVYLLKTDSDGDTLWTGTYGGTGFDYGYSVQQITGGGYIVAGYTTSYGAGYYDVWMLKIAGDGIPPLNPPQNLFVDELGYATWDPPLARDLLGYNIYLDGVFIGLTTDLFWQYTDLVNGQIYIAGVSALYDEGESDPINNDFMYIGTNAENDIILTTKLMGNYPNPFNPTTTISFSVTQTSPFVTLEIFNTKGQKVKTLVNEKLDAGAHQVVWNGTDENNKQVTSGIYYYQLKAGKYTETKKMILLR